MPWGRLPVCSLLSRIDEIPAGRHCTIHRAKIARRSEHEVMPRHLLLDSVSSKLARIKDVASQWLCEMQERERQWTIRAQLTRCDGSGHGVRLDMLARTTFSWVSRSASQESSPTRMRAGNNNRPTPNDISAAFCRAQLAAHELSAKYSLRGEEEAQ